MKGAGGEAKPGKANPAYRHGGRTQEAVALRRWAAEFVREGREVADILPRF